MSLGVEGFTIRMFAKSFYMMPSFRSQQSFDIFRTRHVMKVFKWQLTFGKSCQFACRRQPLGCEIDIPGA